MNTIAEEARIYVAKARARKAEQFAFLFWGSGIPSSDVERLDEVGWRRLATAAGINAPSAVTKKLAIARLREYEEGKVRAA